MCTILRMLRRQITRYVMCSPAPPGEGRHCLSLGGRRTAEGVASSVAHAVDSGYGQFRP